MDISYDLFSFYRSLARTTIDFIYYCVFSYSPDNEIQESDTVLYCTLRTRSQRAIKWYVRTVSYLAPPPHISTHSFTDNIPFDSSRFRLVDYLPVVQVYSPLSSPLHLLFPFHPNRYYCTTSFPQSTMRSCLIFSFFRIYEERNNELMNRIRINSTSFFDSPLIFLPHHLLLIIHHHYPFHV